MAKYKVEDCSKEDREICVCSKCAYQAHGCCEECEGPITGCEDFREEES